MRFAGRVLRGRIAEGSKSEREAVLIDLPQGRYVLRRRDGNAFSDPELDRLVGSEVEGEGNIAGQTMIATEITAKKPR